MRPGPPPHPACRVSAAIAAYSPAMNCPRLPGGASGSRFGSPTIVIQPPAAYCASSVDGRPVQLVFAPHGVSQMTVATLWSASSCARAWPETGASVMRVPPASTSSPGASTNAAPCPRNAPRPSASSAVEWCTSAPNSRRSHAAYAAPIPYDATVNRSPASRSMWARIISPPVPCANPRLPRVDVRALLFVTRRQWRHRLQCACHPKSGVERGDHVVDLKVRSHVHGFPAFVGASHHLLEKPFPRVRVLDRRKLVPVAQLDRPLQTHPAELARGPRDREERRLEAAARHRLRPQPVSLSQDDREDRHGHAGAGHEHPGGVAHQRGLLHLWPHHDPGRVTQG